jgi:hypothetical protein
MCSVPPPSHLTSCTPTKSNLYLNSSLKTVIREPALYRLHTFHNPNFVSVFRRLGHLSKESIQVRGSVWFFLQQINFFTVSNNESCLLETFNSLATSSYNFLVVFLLRSFLVCWYKS